MLLISANAQAASSDPGELEFGELQTLIANTADLSEKDSGQLSDELQLARRQLTGLQQRRVVIDSYRQKAKSYETTAAGLQQDIEAMLELRPAEKSMPTSEAELNAATAELEVTVR